jgi:alpha-beta hydrolase superfamily lysophospholipase
VTDPLPTEIGVRDGLAYSFWTPTTSEPPCGGIVVLHGAGSCKESHHDFARAAIVLGFAVVVFDQRGHGVSAGPMDGRAIADVVTMAELARERSGGPGTPVALRGSSMGGFLAILAAGPAGAASVVAICPASAEGLRRGLHAGTLRFDADVPAVDAMLDAADLEAAVESLTVPLLLLHAEGDEQVPVEHSRELAAHMSAPNSRLVTVPGGHHRSIQHDDDLQALSLRFIGRALATSGR